ncbi:MAG: hypothetical protein AB7F59_04820 [Bdellovibrionales bacterium]
MLDPTCASKTSADTAQIIGQNAAQLALIEVSLGSLVHAFKIPFGGTLLSLNQTYFLVRVGQQTKNHPSASTLPFSVSCIVAMLKSLAPAGNKLAPMVSISMQGFLFSLPLMVFGVSSPALIFGAALSSVWSVLQPLLSYYVLFGPDLFLAAESLAKKTFPFWNLSVTHLLQALFALILVKAFVAVALALLALKKEDSLFPVTPTIIKTSTKKQSFSQSPLLLALKDLLRPLFIFSFLMTGVFLYHVESDSSQLIWKLLRPIAIAFLFFYISRTFLISKLLGKLKDTRWDFLHRAYEIALQQMNKLSRKAI